MNQPNGQLALERDGANTLVRQYVYGLRRIRQTVGTPSYLLYNALGSVVNTVSATGATQRTWSYEPYGVVRTSSGTSPANYFEFAGEYLDPTGLYHLRARQYDRQREVPGGRSTGGARRPSGCCLLCLCRPAATRTSPTFALSAKHAERHASNDSTTDAS